MAVVGAAISAIGGWFTSSAIGSWLTGTIVGRLVTSVALSALQQALARRSMSKQRTPGIQTEYTTEGGTRPMTFMLGRYATAGHMVCPPMWGGKEGKTPNAFLTYVISLGDVPRQTLEAVLINDEEVEFAAESETIPIGGVIPENRSPWWYSQQGLRDYLANLDPALSRFTPGRPGLGDYAGKVWIRYHDGTDTAADSYLLQAYGLGTVWAAESERPWTSDMVGIGTSYVVITFKMDRELWGGLPRCRFVMGGVPLYDIRKDSSAGGSGAHRWSLPSTWETTENAKVQIYNTLRGIPIEGGPYWGLGVDADDLPAASWVAAMNACDVDQGGVPRWRAGFEIAVDEEPLDVIEELKKTCSGQLSESGGVWKPRVGGPGAPVYFFTDADILLSEEAVFTPHPGLAATYNGVQASYPEPEQLWQTKDAPPRFNADYEAADENRRLVADLALPACPYRDQVQRLMRAYIEEERRFRRHTLTLPPEACVLEPLDAISWTSAENGYLSKIFEVSEVEEDEMTGNVRIVIRERDPDDYDWHPDFELPVAIPATNVVRPVAMVPQFFTAEGIAVSDGDGNPRRPAVRLRWGGWALEGISGIRWELRRGDDTARGMMGDPEAGEIVVSGGVLPATDYEARISFIAGAGQRVAWTLWVPVTTPDIGLTWVDFEQEVQDAVDAAMARAEDAAADAEAATQQIAQLRDDIDQDVLDLQSDIDAVEQLAIDNLGVAMGYTDTSVQAETVARQTATDALSAQIQTLTAVLNSENYVENPRFSAGLTAWTNLGGGATADDRDELSSDPVVSAAPTDHFANVAADLSDPRGLGQVFPVEYLDGEVFQWRLYAAAREAGVTAYVYVDWLDAGNVQISQSVTALNLVEDEWRVFSDQAAPPVGTATVRIWLMVLPGPAEEVAFADVSFTRLNQSVLARITDLEVVVANNQQALTQHRDEAESRLDDAEAAIVTEATTRAAADGALSARVTTVEASVGGLEASATAQATALAGIEGNLEAGYLIRAQAGNAVSLIDLVAADGSGAPTSIIKLQADDILLEGSVGARQLVVTANLSNPVPDDQFQAPTLWTLGDTDWSIDATSARPFGSQGVLHYVHAASTGQSGWAMSAPFPVTGGKAATFEWQMHILGAAVDTGRAISGIQFEDQTGAVISSIAIGTRDLAGGVTGVATYRDTVAVPAAARRARLRWAIDRDLTTADVEIGAPRWIVKDAGTTLIDPGGVTSDLITAETMRALNGQFASLAAANVSVGNGEIDNAKIGSVIQSNNFVTGDGGVGWRILKSGAAEFNTVTIRRQIEIASGTLNVANFSPTETGGGNDSAHGGWVSEGWVQFIRNTGVAISAWQGARRTYIATAGMTGTVYGNYSPDILWGWSAEVLPLTRWSAGAIGQNLRLRLGFWSRNVTSVANCTVTWKVYEVS